MVALGDADAMVTGVDAQLFDGARRRAARDRRQARPSRHRRVARAWPAAARCWSPTRRSTKCRRAQELAEIADRSRRRRAPSRLRAARGAAGLLDLRPSARRSARRRSRRRCRSSTSMRVDFEYDGEMSADVALNRELMAHYPFCRLTDPANVLVMPAFHSASISTKMLQELGGATVHRPAGRRSRQAGADRVARRHRQRHRQHGGARGLQYRRLGQLPRVCRLARTCLSIAADPWESCWNSLGSDGENVK